MRKSHTILTLVLHLCFLEESLGRFGPECDDDLFYSPYVKVRRKKNGPNIDSLEKTGFMDLSRYIHTIICLNGPAVLLSNYEVVVNGTTKVSVFSNGTMEVFNHKCMMINKVPKEEIERLRKARVKKRITPDIKVVGVRAAGVHLVGQSGNYTKPTPSWFHRQIYGHDIREDKIITDGSFAIIGILNTTFCLKVDKDFNVVLISKAKSDKEICIWSIKNIDDRYERYQEIFRKNRTAMDYEWLDECLKNETATTPMPDELATTEISILDPFAIIKPHKSRRRLERTTLSPLLNSTDLESTTRLPAEILVEYTVELSICQPFPIIDKTGCIPPPIPDRTCELINQVLLIEPKYLEEELKWKREILDLISQLFGKICEPFSPDMAYTVNRVLEYYLVLAHAKDTDVPLKFRREKIDAWKVIVNDLEICNRKTVIPIWFNWTFENLIDKDKESYFRRRKRSPSHKRSKQNESKPFWSLKSRVSNKRKHKPGRKSKLRKSLRKLELFNFQKCKYNQSYNQSPMDFLEELSLPSSHSKRSALDSATIDSLPWNTTNTSSNALLMNQEFIHKVESREGFNFLKYPVDAYHVSHNKGHNTTSVFYYEDNAEIEYELNVAIDTAWKIWATVAGYCNQHYESRESETFPRFYNTFYEDFMEPVEEDWKFPLDNEILKVVLSEYNSEINARWLDTCLEASYIDSNTETFRPPRPLIVGKERATLSPEANAFLDIPMEQYARFHKVSRVTMSNAGRAVVRPPSRGKHKGTKKPKKIIAT